MTDGRRPSNRAPLITPERWRELELEVGLGMLGLIAALALLPEPFLRLLSAALDAEPVTEAGTPPGADSEIPRAGENG